MAKKSKATGGASKGARSRKQFCFVLMPFREPFDSYYSRIYSPAIKAAGLEPRRIDEVFRAGTIIKDIWEHTVGAELLLAEVTGRNPNVFYELGLAHALSKPVVLITQTLDDVPFDLKHLRHIVYGTIDPEWAKKLEADLTKAIRDTLADPSASLALPGIAATTGPGKDAPTEESEIVTLLKAMDSKIDYMRRDSILTQRFLQDPVIAREFACLPAPVRFEIQELLERGEDPTRVYRWLHGMMRAHEIGHPSASPPAKKPKTRRRRVK